VVGGGCQLGTLFRGCSHVTPWPETRERTRAHARTRNRERESVCVCAVCVELSEIDALLSDCCTSCTNGNMRRLRCYQTHTVGSGVRPRTGSVVLRDRVWCCSGESALSGCLNSAGQLETERLVTRESHAHLLARVRVHPAVSIHPLGSDSVCREGNAIKDRGWESVD
jgi:hypothetical protein